MILEGGKYINEGYKGITMDVFSENSKKDVECNLYNYINYKKPSSLLLYGLHKQIRVYDYNEILELLYNKKEFIVKKFKRGNIFLGNDKRNFKNEFISIKKLAKIYNDKLNYYTTIKPIFKYHGVDIYALSFNHRFYIFQERCYKTIDNIKFTQKEFNKFINDIYESLLILQKSKYIHNDIKADNIIYCNNKYKLIDWDLSGSIYNRFKSFVRGTGGNFMFNHPIKFYSLGLSLFIFKIFYYIFKSKDNKLYNWVYKLKSYKIMEAKSNASASLLISKNVNLHTLTKHYDMYSFALLIIYLAEKNNLKFSKPFVNNLIKPFLISI